MESPEFEYAHSEVAEKELSETLTMRINDGVRRISFEELVKKVGLEMSDLD